MGLDIFYDTVYRVFDVNLSSSLTKRQAVREHVRSPTAQGRGRRLPPPGGVFSDSEDETQAQGAPSPPCQDSWGQGAIAHLDRLIKMVRRGQQPKDWYLTSALINFLDRPPSSLEMLHLSQKVHHRERAGGEPCPR